MIIKHILLHNTSCVLARAFQKINTYLTGTPDFFEEDIIYYAQYFL